MTDVIVYAPPSPTIRTGTAPSVYGGRALSLTGGTSISQTINSYTTAIATTSASITGGVSTTVTPTTAFDTDMIGLYVVVDAYSSSAELAKITGASVITSTAATFANSHSTAAPVAVINGAGLPVEMFGGKTKAALTAACVAATASGEHTVLLPAGQIDVTTGFSMDGYTCGLIGQGAEVCELYASSATGPVLDLDGWEGSPTLFVGNVTFGGFKLRGKNAADASKAQSGLRVWGLNTVAQAITNVRFRDIAITDTGGPCVYMETNVFFCTFDKLTLYRPVGADTNDVPYLHTFGLINSTTFNDLFLRSNTTTADGTKAVFMEYDSGVSYAANNCTFNNPILEYQHTPNSGSIFYIEGEYNLINNLKSFDVVSDTSSPSGNCYIKFSATAHANMVTGYIPSRGTNADSIQYGIIDVGGGNMAMGVKGYRGYNFRLEYTGTTYRSACIMVGAESSATDPSVEYGTSVQKAYHYFHDSYLNSTAYGGMTISQPPGSGSDVLLFQHVDGSGSNANIRFRSLSGPRMRTLAATALEVGADNLILADIAGNAYLQMQSALGGILQFQMTMGNSTKDPTTDAPADWIEVKIGSTSYYLPAYAA